MVSKYSQYGSIGLHSTSHTTYVYSSKMHYNGEFLANKKMLQEFANVTPKILIAPNLEYNKFYFEAIKDLDIDIDSSVLEKSSGNFRYWPYTMDYGLAKGMCKLIDSCNWQPFKGLW